MTHDELLATINWQCEFSKDVRNVPWYKAATALRAVVELHKPIFEEGGKWCDYCKVKLYPCPTIQAIEKELQ